MRLTGEVGASQQKCTRPGEYGQDWFAIVMLFGQDMGRSDAEAVQEPQMAVGRLPRQSPSLVK